MCANVCRRAYSPAGDAPWYQDTSRLINITILFIRFRPSYNFLFACVFLDFMSPLRKPRETSTRVPRVIQASHHDVWDLV
jgi:hypothetical protein